MSKLEKHLEELGEATSGNSHDSVTFAGKGLNFLRDLFKSTKKDDEEEELEESEEEEEEEEKPPQKKAKKTKKNIKKSVRNGGDIEEEDEELDDPGQEGEEEIITNKGKRMSGKGAVKKNASFFDEVRFEKSFDEFEENHGDVLDASDAITDLAKQMRRMAKSTSEGMSGLQNTVLTLGKALEKSLEAQASLAAEMELIKKQPATSPSMGYVVMSKNAEGQPRTLSKSEIQDIVTDAVNEGLVNAQALTRLGMARSQTELNAFVKSLPENVQEKF